MDPIISAALMEQDNNGILADTLRIPKSPMAIWVLIITWLKFKEMQKLFGNKRKKNEVDFVQKHVHIQNMKTVKHVLVWDQFWVKVFAKMTSF